MEAQGIDALLERAESSGVFAEFALCSDAQDFIMVAQSLHVTQRLTQMIASDRYYGEHLVERVGELLDMEVDRQRRHPFDHAIALYLLVLSQTDVQLLGEALQPVRRSRLPNLWFALLMERRLDDDVPQVSDQSFTWDHERSNEVA